MTALPPTADALIDSLPLHLAVLDAEGGIVQVNDMWRTFGSRNGMGWPHGAIGRNYLDVCRQAAADGNVYADRALTGLLGVLAGTYGTFSLDYPIVTAGASHWFQLQAAPCKVGGRRGLVIAHSDVTSRRSAEPEVSRHPAESQEDAARLQAILDLSVDAICSLGADGVVRSVSASAQRIWGAPADQIVGKTWLDLIEPADHESAREALIEARRSETVSTFTTRGVHREQRRLIITWTAQWSSPQQCIVAIARDTTDIHNSIAEHDEALQALRESEERFRLIARTTSDAVWEWDAATGNVWWSQGLGGVFGDVRANWQDGFRAWERRVHPEDLPGVLAEFGRVVGSAEVEFSMEYRFRRLDGAWAIVRARGSVIRNERGAALRALGGLTDVTELRRAEAEARRAAQVQASIVAIQQELARPGVRFDDLLQVMCDRAKTLTGATGAVIELCEGVEQTVTRFASASHQSMLGQPVSLRNSFTGEVLRRRQALLCEDCAHDPRVDPELSRRAGAVAMIGAPLRRGEDIIGVVKVLADRVGIFSPANVDHLQNLTESLRVILHRLSQEAELTRLHRTQRLISLVALAQATIDDESMFLGQVCRLAVDDGGYVAACVLYRDTAGAGDPLRVIARFGEAAEEACHWLTCDAERAHEIVMHALHSAQARSLTVAELPDADCRQAAVAHGVNGVMVLPLLREGGEAFGVLALFSAVADGWTDDERTMLRDLAGALSFGIRHIRAEHDKRLLESAVLKVATGVWERRATEYFEQLCRSVAEALEAPATFVARIVRHSGTPRARTLAGVVDGVLIDSFEYACAGTPCEVLLDDDEAVIPYDLARRYDMSQMRFHEGQAYAGRSLRDSTGAVVGLLIVVWRMAMPRIELTRSLLRIFATRAAFELERRQTEIKLREQASLLDQAKDAIVVRELDGRIRYWNKGAERLYGWPASLAVGQNMSVLLDEDAAMSVTARERVRAEGQWAGTFHYRHREGRRVACETHWTLVRNAEGRGRSILTINTDIGARLAIEEQLRQSHRLESVGQLTGGVAHDFNNLLTVILGNSELLTDALASQPQHRELSEMIRDAAQRGADLTHQLLAFSRKQTLNPQPEKVDRLIVGLIGLLRRALPETISVEHVPGARGEALVDAAQLESALLNLCLNARDAMPRGGRIRIASEDYVVDGASSPIPADLQPGAYVRVCVVDQGSGIEPEHLARVIEPFYTTKPVGKGTGLGLSMAYGFAKQSHGHLAIESEVGRGTTVTLYLPCAPAGAPRDDQRADLAPHERGTESILLVEDDPMVRRFAQGLLSALGYRVIAAEDGAQALRILERDARFDLLFTDVVMPGGITGPELVEAGRRLRPGLRALYSSGYTDHALDGLPSTRCARLLQKPYRRAELAAAIRMALSEPVDV